MAITELILRIVFATFGVTIILALLAAELHAGDNTLDDTVWIICGIVAALFVVAALLGPGALAHLVS